MLQWSVWTRTKKEENRQIQPPQGDRRWERPSCQRTKQFEAAMGNSATTDTWGDASGGTGIVWRANIHRPVLRWTELERESDGQRISLRLIWPISSTNRHYRQGPVTSSHRSDQQCNALKSNGRSRSNEENKGVIATENARKQRTDGDRLDGDAA
jgi:hypothetical protein